METGQYTEEPQQYREPQHVEEPQHAEEPKKRSFYATLVSVVVMVAFVFGLSYLLRMFVFQAYEIPSGSMESTIMTGDMVFAEKVSYYFRDPQPGDIITFEDPNIEGRILIKRCIAIEGQVVNINDQDGLVYVDGVPLDESYTNGKPSYTLDGGVDFPYTVGEDEVWVMGDNRTNSSDSRRFGSIPVDSITGHGVVVYWPFDSIRILE